MHSHCTYWQYLLLQILESTQQGVEWLRYLRCPCHKITVKSALSDLEMGSRGRRISLGHSFLWASHSVTLQPRRGRTVARSHSLSKSVCCDSATWRGRATSSSLVLRPQKGRGVAKNTKSQSAVASQVCDSATWAELCDCVTRFSLTRSRSCMRCGLPLISVLDRKSVV